MPFIIMEQLHIPPASIVHRFCTMLVAISSSQLQVIFMPPLTFSILMVQRGTIMKLGPAGIPVGAPMPGVAMPGAAMPGMPIAVRSIIIAPVICVLLKLRPGDGRFLILGKVAPGGFPIRP
jgi:hypothetical protein